MAGVGGAFASAPAEGAEQRMVLDDMGTGALLTLGIIAVIAATSTGVVQAARVVDRRRELRALALAGAEPALLVRITVRETTLPLALTVVMSIGVSLMLLAPFGAVAHRGTALWLAGAVIGSVVLMWLAVRATGALVREAAQG